MTTDADVRIDPWPTDAELATLSAAAWGYRLDDAFDFQRVLGRSLCHIAAYAGDRLVGFVNVAWDGGCHAFLLDTIVHPEFQRRGIATRIVEAATEEARRRGAEWLHVDYEPHLDGFYRGCGFRPTLAGLIRLQPLTPKGTDT